MADHPAPAAAHVPKAPRLLWIGSPFFSHALGACGFDVHAHNFEDVRVFSWQELTELAGGPPDILVVTDKSRPPFVVGQERFPCLTVFYAVDTHIHSWLPSYAQSFDLCLVSLRDHIGTFRSQRLPDERVVWSPPYALTQHMARPPDAPLPDVPLQASPCSSYSAPFAHAASTRRWPCLFVGTVSPERTPRRVAFLETLSHRLPELHVTSGPFATLYPQADVVLNISELGDLNFRVFEALGCGACLVTPGVGHGLRDLFAPGQMLATYPELDVEGAVQAIRMLLRAPDLRARMAAAGQAAVWNAHRDQHRAEALAAALRALPPDTVPCRLAEADRIRRIWLRQIYLLLADALPNIRLRTAYLHAAKR